MAFSFSLGLVKSTKGTNIGIQISMETFIYFCNTKLEITSQTDMIELVKFDFDLKVTS